MPIKSLDHQLRELKQRMPKGSKLQWESYDDHVYLDLFFIPNAQRGQGSLWFARFLAEVDRHHLPIVLHADPTDLPNDPGTFDLVRWYHRFGFRCQHSNEDEGVAMERPATECAHSPEKILEKYRAQKQRADLTYGQFMAWQSHQAELPRGGVTMPKKHPSA